MQSQQQGRVPAATVDCHDVPFRHFAWPDFVDEPTADSVLASLETADGWYLVAHDEFSHFLELDLRRSPVPALASLTGRMFMDEVRGVCAEQFGVPFTDDIGVTVHHMKSGSRIRVHTDHGVEPVTHRLVLHLNRGWDAANGGLLLLLDTDHRHELHDLHRYYVPVHRLAVGFEISAMSYHAVSEVLQGSRYTICYSLHAAGPRTGRGNESWT